MYTHIPWMLDIKDYLHFHAQSNLTVVLYSQIPRNIFFEIDYSIILGHPVHEQSVAQL